MLVKFPSFVISAAVLAACAQVSATAQQAGQSPGAAAGSQPLTLATATLKAVDGSERGLATLVSTEGKIELRINGTALPPGRHGAHLHAVGRCDAPDFSSAGPHLNPHQKMHGAANPKGSHLGDLPNLSVRANGKGTLAAPVPGLAADVQANVFDADGTAVVIHAAADDYKTDPSGNSGGRVACGVLVTSR